MNSKTMLNAMIVMIVAIGLTGLGSAVVPTMTTVTYNGDGSYDANFNGYGTGHINVRTYTSQGEDHLGVGWQDTNMVGSQSMDQISDTGQWYSYTATEIERDVTVGTGGNGQYATGYIGTYTVDNTGNIIESTATYKDNKAYTSHVNTDQVIAFGSGTIMGDPAAAVVTESTVISGHSYGDDTYVSGYVRTESGNTYTYTSVGMDNGEFELDVTAGTGTVFNMCTAGILVNDASADGAGGFGMGAGLDVSNMYVDIYDDNGYTHYDSYGSGISIDLYDPINDDDYTATGYIYALNI